MPPSRLDEMPRIACNGASEAVFELNLHTPTHLIQRAVLIDPGITFAIAENAVDCWTVCFAIGSAVRL